jgi:hypothetical protein
MRSWPIGAIRVNTGSRALLHGAVAALLAVALVVKMAGVDVTLPVHSPLWAKPHSEAELP